jgi:hypothetical protein
MWVAATQHVWHTRHYEWHGVHSSCMQPHTASVDCEGVGLNMCFVLRPRVLSGRTWSSARERAAALCAAHAAHRLTSSLPIIFKHHKDSRR